MDFYKYSVEKIVVESSTIKSFYLVRKEGEKLQNYFPGQFITLRVKPTKEGKAIIRNYTLSDRPGTGYYRITVKNETEGTVSKYLHSQIRENDTLEISNPLGDFYLNESTHNPIVFLSGGVGITPMLSMLEHLVFTNSKREVFFLHSSLNKNVQPMANRLNEIKNTSEYNINIHHTHPLPYEQKGMDYDNTGLITDDFIKSFVEVPQNCIYYLCGPYGFMQAMYNYLVSLGVSESDIHYEFFGNAQKLGSQKINSKSSENGCDVKLLKSNKTIKWNNTHNSILELVESADIFPENSCRMGTCSTCETKLISGKIKYDPEPFMEAQEGHVLICCSQPMSDLVLEI